MSERTLYQRYYFSENELSLVDDIFKLQNEKILKLSQSEINDNNIKKMKKHDIILTALKYYYNL